MNENNSAAVYQFLDALDISQLDVYKANRGKWRSVLEEFLLSDSKYCLITCKNEKELNACRVALYRAKKLSNLDITVGRYGRGTVIYVAKP